jgi:hypothetical protein
MTVSFDPYTDWLSIPAGPRPPEHYTLLGLPPGETDPQRIYAAAARRMAEVRKYHAGQHGDLAVRLIGELAAAYAQLSDPDPHAQHDTDPVCFETLVDSEPATTLVEEVAPCSSPWPRSALCFHRLQRYVRTLSGPVGLGRLTTSVIGATISFGLSSVASMLLDRSIAVTFTVSAVTFTSTLIGLLVLVCYLSDLSIDQRIQDLEAVTVRRKTPKSLRRGAGDDPKAFLRALETCSNEVSA